MPRFDWNGNGKKDIFDDFMDMKVMEEVNKQNSIDDYDDNNYVHNTRIEDRSSLTEDASGSHQDSNSIVILKCLLVIGMCIGVMALYASGSWVGGLL